MQIQNKPKQDIVDEYFMQEIRYAEHEINSRNLYHSSLEVMKQMTIQRDKELLHTNDQKKNRKIGRMSMRLQWLNDFSEIGNEI
jgi:hypothetical protein